MKFMRYLPIFLLIIILSVRIISLSDQSPIKSEISVNIDGESVIEIDVETNVEMPPITSIYDPVKKMDIQLEMFNNYDVSSLQNFNGVGEITAQRIYDYIHSNGPLTDFRDLINVNGIGEKKLNKLIQSKENL